MNQPSFFNTTHEAPATVEEYTELAGYQNRIVYDFYATEQPATPSECYEWLKRWNEVDSSTPLTSIRRSITVLTKQGLLEKTDVKRTGPYGRPEYVWQLAIKEDRQLQLSL